MRRDLDRVISKVAAAQHGAFTLDQAREAGFSAAQIRTRLAKGWWANVGRRGLYAIAGAPGTFEQRAMIAVLPYPAAAISHAAAAYLLGLLRRPETIDITVANSAHHASGSGIRVHRASSLGRSDIRRIGCVSVTRAERVLVDLAGILDPEGLEAVLDAAIEKGLVSVVGLMRYVHDRSLGRRKGGAVLRSLLADRSLGVPGSELERVFVRIAKRARLPEPERQFRVGPRRVDFAYPHLRIAIELDGLAHHRTKAAFVDDRRRQNFLVLEGWVVLRFTWDDLTKHEAEVVATIRDALTTVRARAF